jgi:hypothetical protein
MTPYELRYRDPNVKQPENIPINEFTEGILRRKKSVTTWSRNVSNEYARPKINYT